MIFKTVYKKGNKYLVKIVGLNPDDEKGTWATTTSAVYNWAKKTYEDGDEVDAEYSVKDGEYKVTRITGGKGASKSDTRPPDEEKDDGKKRCSDCGKVLKDDKYDKCYDCNQKNKSKSDKPKEKTCADCGKKLKDDKYDKCYTCNQKNPSKSSTGKPDYKNGAPYGSLLPKEEIRRNKLATLSSVCQAIQVLQGQIDDVNTLGEMLITLYKKAYKELFG